MGNKVILTTGGTGGHIFPALSLAAKLQDKGYKPIFLGDKKIAKFGGKIDWKIKLTYSSQINKKSLLKACFLIFFGFIQSAYYLIKFKPKYVIGFGGYATFPCMLAAKILGKKIIIHEQNAYLGKVNRIFANNAQFIATSFEETQGILDKHKHKIILTGNFVRSDIAKLNKIKQKAKQDDDRFNILVIGGSGGAAKFSEVLPEAFLHLNKPLKGKLTITHQVRSNDVNFVRKFYKRHKLKADVESFFFDIDQKINQADLVIGRCGSSTIFELCAAKKAMILVPFSKSADNHQLLNGLALAKAEAAVIVREEEFNCQNIENTILKLATDEAKMENLIDNCARFYNKCDLDLFLASIEAP